MDGVEAGQAGADDHDIELTGEGTRRIGHGESCVILLCGRFFIATESKTLSRKAIWQGWDASACVVRRLFHLYD